jgi:hypothetical protein
VLVKVCESWNIGTREDREIEVERGEIALEESTCQRWYRHEEGAIRSHTCNFTCDT